MGLLLLIDDDKSHYVYTNILTDLCFTKQEITTKNGSVKVVQCFSGKNVLTKHKEDRLSINGKLSVKLEGIIEFKTYFKQNSC